MLEEYLAIEREAVTRSEFFDGEMFAMAGGSPRHSLICANVIREAGMRLKGQPCTVYDSKLRIAVEARGLYTYPDASIVCGPLAYGDDRNETVVNPTVVIEVLSTSTEAYDRGKKFNHYRRIASLREYLLISQDEPRIERFHLGEGGSWVFTEAAGLLATLTLQSPAIGISLREVYDKLSFNESAAPGPRVRD